MRNLSFYFINVPTLSINDLSNIGTDYVDIHVGNYINTTKQKPIHAIENTRTYYLQLSYGVWCHEVEILLMYLQYCTIYTYSVPHVYLYSSCSYMKVHVHVHVLHVLYEQYQGKCCCSCTKHVISILKLNFLL